MALTQCGIYIKEQKITPLLYLQVWSPNKIKVQNTDFLILILTNFVTIVKREGQFLSLTGKPEDLED